MHKISKFFSTPTSALIRKNVGINVYFSIVVYVFIFVWYLIYNLFRQYESVRKLV
jgi:hypothetical protein